MLTTLPKHYLVTGGCGFIGSHLVDKLIEEGHKVTVLDNLSTGKKENLHPEASLVVGSTTDYKTVAELLANVHGCFHLAAVASVERSLKEWADTHTVNITSTVNIFQAASRLKVKIPVVYTSSAAVYGNYQSVPIAEDAPTYPITAYGVDKLACDMHGRVAWHIHKVPNLGLRPFNVYGPRQDPGSPYSGVISIFTDHARRGLPVTIYGDGGQVRDFVYVGDAVRAFISAMNYLSDVDIQKVQQEQVNLCTGRATSINQLVEAIERVTGYSLERNHAPARQGDIRLSVGNPRRLSDRLGIRCQVTLQDGLNQMFYPDASADQSVLRLRQAV